MDVTIIDFSIIICNVTEIYFRSNMSVPLYGSSSVLKNPQIFDSDFGYFLCKMFDLIL